jgi:thioesterase domain-containing protein
MHHTTDRPSQKKFRSRHYDPETDATQKFQVRLLEPHVLSARLKKLSDNGKIDDAIVMLENAPLDAQNTQVWNTMIWETLKAKRYSLAYQLYIDVRLDSFHSLLLGLILI